MTLKVPMSGLG